MARAPWPSGWPSRSRCAARPGGGRRCSGPARAISFAFTAACTKAVADYAAHDWTSLYRHWQTYALAAFGALAVFLAQNAFHAGPIVASQSSIVLVDPLASILIGVGIFGDNLRTSGP